MLEEILDRRNIEKALCQVEAHKGAAGVDGMRSDELRSYISVSWQDLRRSTLEGRYRPSPVRKVEIDKPQGGKRMLGIPTVVEVNESVKEKGNGQAYTKTHQRILNKWNYGRRGHQST
jgi:RNA-directed DNA polymerase